MSTNGKTDLALLHEQLLAEAAQDIKTAIAKPTGRRITVNKATREFALPDGLILGNSFRAVVVDYMSWNRYYTKPFQPNQPIPPACFAYGKDISKMAPSDNAPEKQSATCAPCPMNQFKSDPKGGNGKACKNTRELAIILEADADKPDAPIYTLSVSPTAIKYFDAIVGLIFRTMEGPPIMCSLEVLLNPNTDYVQVLFDKPQPNKNLTACLARRQEAQDLLSVEPDLSGYQVPQAAARPAPARPAARSYTPTSRK